MRQSNFWVSFLLWRSRNISTQNFIMILSILIGIVTGLAAATLKGSVELLKEGLFNLNDYFQFNYLFLIYPFIGLLLTALFTNYLNKGNLGRGIGNILYSISKKAGVIERDKTYSHVITSFFTVGFGGSVGLEAPIVTTGAAMGSNFSQLFHLDYKQRLLLLGCGVSGAISAIFAAPIAAVIFVFEVLAIQMGVTSFIPILLSSITGMIVATALGTAEVILPYTQQYELLLPEIPFYILLGIVTGIVALLFTSSVFRINQLFDLVKSRIPKTYIGGLILGLLLFIFPPLYGEGYEIIRSLLSERPDELLANANLFDPFIGKAGFLLVFLLAVILFKILATSVTLSAGGNGGIFAPSLFVGAVVGFLFARILNSIGLTIPVSESAFALVAMAGIMSGTMHAPLTGIFLIAEVTSGYSLFLPLMIVSSISYVTNVIFEPHTIFTKKLAEKGELAMHDKDKMVLNLLRIKRVIETDLLTVKPTDKLGNLVEVVKKSKRNIFPVVDEENELKGIILLDDIRNVMFRPEMYDETLVSDLMHAPPGHVDIHDPMDEVMKKFKDTDAWNLPVLDGEKYVGFVSKSKIFSIYRTMLIHHTRED